MVAFVGGHGHLNLGGLRVQQQGGICLRVSAFVSSPLMKRRYGVGRVVDMGANARRKDALNMQLGGGSAAGDNIDKLSDEEMQRVIQELIRRKEEADALKKKELREKAEASGMEISKPLAHGEKGRFAPLTRIDEPDFMPRVAPVVGWLNELSPDEVTAVPKLPRCDIGSVWNGIRVSEYKYEIMTLPPADKVISSVLDPVVILAQNTELGIPLDPDSDVAVVVDRAQTQHEPGVFFIWDVNGKLRAGHYEEKPEDAKCLGEIIRILFHIKVKSEAKVGGFAEFSDDFEF